MIAHASTALRRPPLAIQRLALRVIRGDEHAALVLADAMQEAGVDRVLTGRSRPVRFTARGLGPLGADVPVFYVRGMEVLFNVNLYRGPRVAKEGRSWRPRANMDEERFPDIWRMWMTRKRDIFRAAKRAGAIARTVAFRTIDWAPANYQAETRDSELAYQILIPRKTRRGRDTPIALVWSLEPQSIYLDEPGGIERPSFQLDLFSDARRDHSRVRRRS